MNYGVVFDFDCTFSSVHFFKTLRNHSPWDKKCLLYYKKNGHIEDKRGNYKLEGDTSFELLSLLNDRTKQRNVKQIIQLLRTSRSFGYYIMGGYNRVCMIKNMISTLKLAGVSLYMSTLGFVDEIIAILEAVDISIRCFECIQGKIYHLNSDIGLYHPTVNKITPFNSNKRTFINMIKKLRNLEILYIDDNVICDEFANDDIQIMKLPHEGSGMNSEHIQNIYHTLNLRKIFTGENQKKIFIGTHIKTLRYCLKNLSLEVFIRSKTYEMGDYKQYPPGEPKENRICVDVDEKNIVCNSVVY